MSCLMVCIALKQQNKWCVKSLEYLISQIKQAKSITLQMNKYIVCRILTVIHNSYNGYHYCGEVNAFINYTTNMTSCHVIKTLV